MTEWERIVRDHGPKVWRTVFGLLGNEADAADCVQETFVAAWRASRRERIENWGGLLYRMAAARAFDRLRQRYRLQEHSALRPDWSSTLSPNPGPTEEAEAAELVEQLRVALSQLASQEAEVFCLHCMDGLSYRAVGDELGMETNAVGVVLHRARSKLRKLLSAYTADRKE